jgi:hypothetical protein
LLIQVNDRFKSWLTQPQADIYLSLIESLPGDGVAKPGHSFLWRRPNDWASHMSNVITLDREFPRTKTAKVEPRPTSGSAEIIMFAGIDFRAVAQAVEYWRRTGKTHADDRG